MQSYPSSEPSTMTAPTDVQIRALQPGEDASAFRILNEEWITRFFVLEQPDREVLGDPHGTILARGGHILMAYAGGAPVGTVALIPGESGAWELSKMAVSPGLRGLGIGRKLIEQAISLARRSGAATLFLGSSTKLANAIHLYESVGFRHVPPSALPGIHYTRADVFMQMSL